MFCRSRVFGSILKTVHFAAELEDEALAHKLTEGR